MRNKISPTQSSEQYELADKADHTHLAVLRDHLLCYCELLSGSRHEAEDLVQTTFLKALPVVQAQSHPNIPALLRRIAKNTWIDETRKHNRYRLYDPQDLVALGGHVALDTAGEVEAAFQVLMQSLTQQQQAVFLLSEVFEYTDREIAEVIGTSKGAVKATLHRAKARLHAILPDTLEHLSADDEDQQEIMKAYLAAFQAYDMRMLIQLCQAGPRGSSGPGPVSMMLAA